MILKIGLTGGIATGKSSVSNILKQKGAIIIDADKIVHKLMEPEQKLWYDIINAFGKNILLENNQINRKKLGEIIFNDQNKREKLNQITHPRVIAEIKKKMDKLAADNNIIVAEVPLLFEVGMEDLFTEVWVVTTDKEIQIKRLKQRDGLDAEAAQKRIEAQMPLAKKEKLADRIINNNGTKKELLAQINLIWSEAISYN